MWYYFALAAIADGRDDQRVRPTAGVPATVRRVVEGARHRAAWEPNIRAPGVRGRLAVAGGNRQRTKAGRTRARPSCGARAVFTHIRRVLQRGGRPRCRRVHGLTVVMPGGKTNLQIAGANNLDVLASTGRRPRHPSCLEIKTFRRIQ